MGFFILTLSAISGLLIYVIAYYIFRYKNYIQKEIDDFTLVDSFNTGICFICFCDLFVTLMMWNEMYLHNQICFIIGLSIGIISSIIFIFTTVFSSYGKYARLLNKIEKIENNIDLLRENRRDLTQSQRQAISLFEDASIKLKEQAHNILIMSSIKVAKNIELSNKNINIQRELDELEALQILNKR